jgi:hypothetical protein
LRLIALRLEAILVYGQHQRPAGKVSLRPSPQIFKPGGDRAVSLLDIFLKRRHRLLSSRVEVSGLPVEQRFQVGLRWPCYAFYPGLASNVWLDMDCYCISKMPTTEGSSYRCSYIYYILLYIYIILISTYNKLPQRFIIQIFYPNFVANLNNFVINGIVFHTRVLLT